MDPPLLQASDADDAALVDLSLTDDTAAATAVPAVPAIQHHVPAISPVQDFFAGTLAGVSLTLVGHPFDTVKVRLQTQSNRYRGGIHCLKDTIAKEGFFALYKGMAGPMLTIPLVNAIVFASYAQAKDLLHRLQDVPAPLTLTQIALAGGYSGFINCLVVCPVELVKTRLQIQHEAMTLALPSLTRLSHSSPRPRPHIDPDTRFDGPVDAVRKIISHNGIKGMFRGMSATIYREVPGYATQFWCYEGLKRMMTREGEKAHDLGAIRLICAGGTAGIFGWIWSYPMDFIKSQIQSEPYEKKTPYKKNPYLFDGGFISCWKQTVRTKGIGALWTGFGTCCARAFPANAAGFLAYEVGLKMAKKAWPAESQTHTVKL